MPLVYTASNSIHYGITPVYLSVLPPSLCLDSVLKALHINNGILTDTECGKCANAKWNWHKLTAIVIATKLPGVVQQALVVLQEQAASQCHTASIKALARLLKGECQ